jgi:hypothetical protein
MKDQDAALKRANIRLALILGAIAMLLAAWPLYALREAMGS